MVVARVICAVVAVVVTAMPTVATAQTRAPEATATISPSVSPTPPPGGSRRPAPGFVLLLVLLLLGLVWQAQRVRRSTADASARALSDFERRVGPDDAPPEGPV